MMNPHLLLGMLVMLTAAASAAPPNRLPWSNLLKPAIEAEEDDRLIFRSSIEFEQEWESFRLNYGKNYEDEREEIMRKEIFADNLKKIEKHNSLYQLGLKTFTMGINQFADLELNEFLKMMTCYSHRNVSRNSIDLSFSSAEGESADPASVDWRNKGYVTPVKNQGACGSCWAFSATGSLEGQNYRKTGKLVSLSEQNLVDCSRSFGNEGCGGGWMDSAFKYVKSNGGIDTEASYPYEAKDGTCRYKPGSVGGHCSGFVDILKGSESSLKTSVASVGPVAVAIDAAHSSFQLYKSGIYNEPKCSSSTLDHGVLVVGYGTTSSGQSYWIVKNSWGVGWGNAGYIWMSQNKKNQCGIATAASYPLV